MCIHVTRTARSLFVCVEVLRPSQPNWVMSSAVSLPNHTFTGQAQYCAHSFARNWQLPFLNQRKGENDRRKYFMINLHERMLPTSAGVEPATSLSPVGRRIQLSHRGRKQLNDVLLLSTSETECKIGVGWMCACVWGGGGARGGGEDTNTSTTLSFICLFEAWTWRKCCPTEPLNAELLVYHSSS